MAIYNMSICVGMKELSTFIGNKLSTSMGKLNALLKLNLSWCTRLQQLLTSIGQLNALQEFNLSECSSLQELPTSIGQLNAL